MFRHITSTGFLALTLICAALAGCSESSSTAPEAPRHTAARIENGLQFTVSTAKASYAFGEEIGIQATLTNIGADPVTLTFERGRPARYPNLNINVDDETGFAVYAEGEGENDQVTLAPGQGLSYSYTWDQVHRLSREPAERGFYSVGAFCGLTDGTTLRSGTLFVELQ